MSVSPIDSAADVKAKFGKEKPEDSSTSSVEALRGTREKAESSSDKSKKDRNGESCDHNCPDKRKETARQPRKCSDPTISGHEPLDLAHRGNLGKRELNLIGPEFDLHSEQLRDHCRSASQAKTRVNGFIVQPRKDRLPQPIGRGDTLDVSPHSRQRQDVTRWLPLPLSGSAFPSPTSSTHSMPVFPPRPAQAAAIAEEYVRFRSVSASPSCSNIASRQTQTVTPPRSVHSASYAKFVAPGHGRRTRLGERLATWLGRSSSGNESDIASASVRSDFVLRAIRPPAVPATSELFVGDCNPLLKQSNHEGIAVSPEEYGTYAEHAAPDDLQSHPHPLSAGIAPIRTPRRDDLARTVIEDTHPHSSCLRSYAERHFAKVRSSSPRLFGIRKAAYPQPARWNGVRHDAAAR